MACLILIMREGNNDMGRKSSLLNNLFDEWELAHLNETEESLLKTINGENIRKDFFQRDGIIDEDVFENEKRRVLFISSEANVNEHSAARGESKSNYQDIYINYFKGEKENWHGRMRERICALYQVLAKISDLPYHKVANRFAVMDLNKRGGRSKIDGGKHIVEYCKIYKDFIKQEIEIINPDIIVWIGTNTYDLGIPDLLGAITKSNKKFFRIRDMDVPILRMWQTSYYQAKIAPLPGYENNKTIGKQCARLVDEMKSFDLE